MPARSGNTLVAHLQGAKAGVLPTWQPPRSMRERLESRFLTHCSIADEALTDNQTKA